jgi:hypothetical protein
MELAIVQNPHVQNPRELWDVLKSYERVYNPQDDELDKAGFALLKDRLRGNPRIMVK